MKLRQDHPIEVAAAKAGMSRASGCRIMQDPKLPSRKARTRGRRRPDPLEHIFDAEVVPLLQTAPGLRPVAIFEEMLRRRPELSPGIRRTLVRRVRAWRAEHGEDREVIFRQVHEPGRVGLSGFTDPGAGTVTIAGQPLEHLLHHFRCHKWMGTSRNDRRSNAIPRHPIGCFHIDMAELGPEEGTLHLFVAIDRTSRCAVAQLVERAHRKTPWEVLEHRLEAVPCRIHTILSDNGIPFAEQPRTRDSVTFPRMRFDLICETSNIEHRLTRPNHPWTNGQVERMNRTIKDATVKRDHHDDHDQRRGHLVDFLDACDFARRLKTLQGVTPYEYICEIWTTGPERFKLNPIHQMPGSNT